MTNKKIAILVRNLDEEYTIGRPQEQYLTLRNALVNSIKTPFKQYNRSPSDEGLRALKNVSFALEQGELEGIIGRNETGKSTLQKILSWITASAEGTEELYRRVGSMREEGNRYP